MIGVRMVRIDGKDLAVDGGGLRQASPLVMLYRRGQGAFDSLAIHHRLLSIVLSVTLAVSLGN